mmetsp:Transcript_2262/g.6129  ORF Transcript_2262/g.6129 Transcript_2262/m.6129 type:complete len:246 (+) Transcript_2262:173-910(+)
MMLTHSFFKGSLRPFPAFVLNHFQESFVATCGFYPSRHQFRHRRQIHHSVQNLTQSCTCKRNKCQHSPDHSHIRFSFHALAESTLGLLQITIDCGSIFHRLHYISIQHFLVLDDTIYTTIHRGYLFDHAIYTPIYSLRIIHNAVYTPIHRRHILYNVVHAPIHRRRKFSYLFHTGTHHIQSPIHRQCILHHTVDALVRLIHCAAQCLNMPRLQRHGLFQPHVSIIRKHITAHELVSQPIPLSRVN